MERKDRKHGYSVQDEEKYLSVLNSWSLNGMQVGALFSTVFHSWISLQKEH